MYTFRTDTFYDAIQYGGFLFFQQKSRKLSINSQFPLLSYEYLSRFNLIREFEIMFPKETSVHTKRVYGTHFSSETLYSTSLGILSMQLIAYWDYITIIYIHCIRETD